MATKADQNPNAQFASLVGGLYSVWTLDCLVEIAYAISIDFIARPQLYLSNDIPDAIVDLRMTWGTAVTVPNTAQRQSLMMPIFGKSDGLRPDASTGSAPFHVARKKLIDACVAFSERAVDTGVPMLEERVRSALIPLQAHFQGLRGKSLDLAAVRQMNPIAITAVSILQSEDVARVFSVTPPDSNWPFNSDDPNGAKLIENVGASLPLPPECKIAYTKFIVLQRVAREGALALGSVITVNPSVESELLALISAVYTWGTSLRDFQQMP